MSKPVISFFKWKLKGTLLGYKLKTVQFFKKTTSILKNNPFLVLGGFDFGGFSQEGGEAKEEQQVEEQEEEENPSLREFTLIISRLVT